MGMAEPSRQSRPGSRLQDVIRETLRPHLSSTGNLDQVTEALLLALRGRFAVAVRRPKPRLDTPRARAHRLPEVGVAWTFTRRGVTYSLRITGDHELEVEYNGHVERFESLKAAARAICGYSPSVGGWVFFFGTLDHAEVSARYGKTA
jgi:hypothetical protein